MHREDSCVTEAESEVKHLQDNTEGCQTSLKSGKEAWNESPSELPEAANLANTLVSDF